MNGRVMMAIDLDRCWGCRACEVACKQELGLGVGPRPMRVIDSGAREVEGALQRDFIPSLCQHCDDPACLAACPTEAIERAADGTIQIRGEACIACGACLDACPFGVMETMGEGEPPVKCTLCRERREAGGIPSCAQHCTGGAITLVAEGDLDTLVAGRHHWRTGRILYVSDKWASLGEALSG
jgi:Fe-S-cluster-containing dehydrogenase component